MCYFYLLNIEGIYIRIILIGFINLVFFYIRVMWMKIQSSNKFNVVKDFDLDFDRLVKVFYFLNFRLQFLYGFGMIMY